jgi:bacterioferritin-associated ferredoxin
MAITAETGVSPYGDVDSSLPLGVSLSTTTPHHMAVTRCVCYQKSFRELLQLARSHGWSTAAEISLETGCGLGCGGCRPYLEEMLRSGATCFAVRTDDSPPKPCTPEPWDLQ